MCRGSVSRHCLMCGLKELILECLGVNGANINPREWTRSGALVMMVSQRWSGSRQCGQCTEYNSEGIWK